MTTEVTRALLEEEAPGLLAWARRKGWGFHIDYEKLFLVAWFPHPVDRGLLVLEVDVTDYKALPPVWRFLDIGSGKETKHAFPKGHDSLLNGSKLICAHWSRLAYSDLGGPHANWNGPSKWLDVREGTLALSLGEMFAVLHGRVQLSPGRLE